MKKAFFFAIFCLIIYARPLAQIRKDSVVNRALSLYQQNDFAKALILFEQAIGTNSGHIKNSIYFYAACNAAKCDSIDLAFHWLFRYGELTDEPQTNVVLLQTNLENLFNDKRWQPFISMLKQKEYKKDSSLS